MNIYILEDEWIEQVNLENIINQLVDKHGFTINALQAYSKVADLKKDLPAPSVDNVFLLDLQIGDDRYAGLKLGRELRKRDFDATIIFITVHDELMPITYKYQIEGLDFIAKDRDDISARLLSAFQLVAEKNQRLTSDTVILKRPDGFIRVKLDEILYFTPNPQNTHQSLLYLSTNQQITVLGTLKKVEKVSPLFFRCHRSWLINLDKIVNVNTRLHYIELNGTDQKCQLARMKAAPLLKRLQEL